jgi:hypothetical protein
MERVPHKTTTNTLTNCARASRIPRVHGKSFVCVYCHKIVDLAENYISLVDSEDRMAHAHPRCQDLAEVIAASHPPKKPPLYICVTPKHKAD